MKRSINYKKLIISIIITSIVYVSMAMENIISKYNVILLPILLLIVKVVYDTKFDKKYKKTCIILSSIYTLLFVFGSITQEILTSDTLSFFGQIMNIHTLYKLFMSFPIFYVILVRIFPILEGFKINGERKQNKKLFFKCFIGILLLWLPYFLIYFPGFLSVDSVDQIAQIVNNSFTNHHPVFHTMFEYIPYNLGMTIFNNPVIATSLITITQMIIMSLIFSYLICFLYKRNINKIIMIIVFLYYAILPMNVLYSMILWKDIIFAGLIIILSIQLLKIIETKQFTVKQMIIFGIICLITMLFRHNALYMMFLLAIVLIIVYRKSIKYILPTFVIVFASYFIINIPVFNYFNIERSSSAEYIAIPLQQIGRIAYKNLEIPEESESVINKLMPIELIKQVYNPMSVNPIKFNENFDVEYFNNNKGEVFKAYLNIISKHFGTAVEGYFTATLGYWYPNVDEWTVPSEVAQNNLGIKQEGIIPGKSKITDRLITKLVPLYNFIWSIGLYVWLIIFAIGYILYKKEYRKLIVYVPIIGIWLSLMVAAPVYAEYRYMYPFVTTLPLMLLLPFIKLKKYESKEVK